MKRLIAIPAYNEHENIHEVILGVSSTLNLAGYEADIIVFDDRSTDDTVNIVKSTGIASVETSEARGGYWENVQRAVLAGHSHSRH